MKKAVVLILVFSSIISHAQWRINTDKEEKFTEQDQKTWSWGYYVGLNHYSFKLQPKFDYSTINNIPDGGAPGVDSKGKFTITSESKIGFSAGLMGKLRVNDYVDVWLNPGLNFTERDIIFNNIKPGNTYYSEYENPETGVMERAYHTAVEADTIRNIKSTYLDVPILIEVHGNRWFNTRPFVQAGVGYSLNLQSNAGSVDDNLDNMFRMTTHNFNWQLGAGINIYFRRFKLTPSIKGIFFLNNELVPDDPETPAIWAGALSSMKTRAILFSLKFE